MKLKKHLVAALCALAGALGLHASTLVSLDTTGLIGNAAGPFYIDFQFNDGTGAHDNLVSISNINLGGGTVVGPATLFGGVTGDLLAGITLTDSEPLAEFYQQFTPGAFLTFQLWTTNMFTGLTPDVFGFAILDSNLFNLATYAAVSDQLLIVKLGGSASGPVLDTYATVDGSVPAPHIPDTGSTLALAFVALAGLGLTRRLTLAHRRDETH